MNDPFQEIHRGLSAALTKHSHWPNDPLHALAVITEEHGELAREVLQSIYEPHKGSTQETIQKEAIHLAAMAIRFAYSLQDYRPAPSAQHIQTKLENAIWGADPARHRMGTFMVADHMLKNPAFENALSKVLDRMVVQSVETTEQGLRYTAACWDFTPVPKDGPVPEYELWFVQDDKGGFNVEGWSRKNTPQDTL